MANSTHHLASSGPNMGSDIHHRVAQIAEPSTDIRTKLEAAVQVREMLDTTVRDTDAPGILPVLIPTVLEILRTGPPSAEKQAPETQFRRQILDIIYKLPFHESVRTHVMAIFTCMVHILRNDNEDMGVTSVKVIQDTMRIYKAYTEETLHQVLAVKTEVYQNVQGMVDEFLSEDSPPVPQDRWFPSPRSFKVLNELSALSAIILKHYRGLLPESVSRFGAALQVINIEVPAQAAARAHAREAGTVWAGMSPSVKNVGLYTELIAAQIKIASFLTIVMVHNRSDSANGGHSAEGDQLLLSCLRMMQDLAAPQPRKELIAILRHLLPNHRTAMLGHVDELLDERVLLGVGLTGRESLRLQIYPTVSDFLYHLKQELSLEQLGHILHVYAMHLHNPIYGINLHHLFSKAMLSVVEPIVAKLKDTSPQAARYIIDILKTYLDRLESLAAVLEDCRAAYEEKKRQKPLPLGQLFIEHARPVDGAAFAYEKPEDYIQESRALFRMLLHGIRACLSMLKKLGESETPLLEGVLIFRMFKASIRCLAVFEADSSRVPESSDSGTEPLFHVLMEINLYVFQEVWTHNIAFFYDIAKDRPALMELCRHIMSANSAPSPTLLAIVMKFLMERLATLGNSEEMEAVATIRLFRIAFNAVASHPQTNEQILAPHLGKLLMDCFPLAAKATIPKNYFLLLRSLFRSIGGGGGRFEHLYKEVVPLLPEMLECLNRQMLACEDGPTKDLIVELCLTVPLRLTHLLPHLMYLMQPLALSLRSPDNNLAQQGLRTLELCIDNLTPDFLDPTLNAVLRDVMEALQAHLKPLPGDHNNANSVIRIMGKLGGRNRRLLGKPPVIDYIDDSDKPEVPLSFVDGRTGAIDLGPIGLLSRCIIGQHEKHETIVLLHAYEYLENSVSYYLYQKIEGRNQERFFTSAVEGLFDAIHVKDLQERAASYLRMLAKVLFQAEIQKERTSRFHLDVRCASFLDAWPAASSKIKKEEGQEVDSLLSDIVNDLANVVRETTIPFHAALPVLAQISNRFVSLCYEDSGSSKRAGCRGFAIMIAAPVFGTSWVKHREIELVRTLLHVLNDVPMDVPHDVQEVKQLLESVLRICNSVADMQALDGAIPGKILNLVGVFFPELQNSNPAVRDTVRSCIELLVELSGRQSADLLRPHIDRILKSVYQKPLRALPFPVQIGMVEVVRYCVSVEPSIVDLGDELLRLLHETLALADAEDSSLMGRAQGRQNAAQIVKLRIACIKLLTASMPLTDFFSKQPQTRTRVASVYFKTLYSPHQEIKDVAHQGLKMVLVHQTKLPKELLQAGLRPILMNLADAKRLSVASLEGLARLLKLLTNYFKVEIGHKLLDHFRTIAESQMQQGGYRVPIADQEGIAKLVRLANIFHLLPSAAHIFLQALVDAIVKTESSLHFSGPSPFSEPLGNYLDRYPGEGADYFLDHLASPRHLRTIRSILEARLAPSIQLAFMARTSALVSRLRGDDETLVLPALSLLTDLISLDPRWEVDSDVVEALLYLWRSHVTAREQIAVMMSDIVEKHVLLIQCFQAILRQNPRIDILFDLISVYTRGLEMDPLRLTHFLYSHVAMNESTFFRRNVVLRFIMWFKSPERSWKEKGHFIRNVITPMLLIHAERGEHALPGKELLSMLNTTVWQHPQTYVELDDSLKIDLLHLTSVLVQHYSEDLLPYHKEVIKFATQFTLHPIDLVVRQTALLLSAHFFARVRSPAKFILNTWTTLLRLGHTDGRPALRTEALNVLVPSLKDSELPDPNRVGSGELQEGGPPAWAKATRHLLIEDGSSYTYTIFLLIVQNSNLFFPVRELFVTYIVGSLQKLGLLVNATLETKLLSIELLQIVFDWDMRAEAIRTSDTSAMEVDGSTVSEEWKVPLAYRENMVSYLVRLATFPHDVQYRGRILQRTLDLLNIAVGPEGWPDVTFGTRYFMRALDQADLSQEGAIAIAVASAKVLQVISKDQGEEWYTENAPVLQQLVRKGLTTDDASLHDALHPIFDRLVKLYPLPKEDEEHQGELSDFHTWIYSALADGLKSATALRGPLLMLKSVVDVNPERIEPFSAALMKLFGKVMKDHATSASPASETSVRLLIAIIDICQVSMMFLSEQRRHLLQGLAGLVQRSSSLVLCRYILDLSRDWALVRTDPYPTMKEKSVVLQHLNSFELKDETLFNAFLELIYEIYTAPSLKRSDLTSRLETSFFLGCHAKDPSLRARFLDLLDASIPRSLYSRLTYICAVQSWEPLADKPWIHIALHLLLGASIGSDESLMDVSGDIVQPKLSNITSPMRRLLSQDPQTAHEMWISIFPAAWASLSKREQTDLTLHIGNLLSKEYHTRQASLRPNVVQTLLEGILPCSPPLILSPHLVKYLAKNFSAWHAGLEVLENSLEQVRDDDAVVRDYVYDSLADLYGELCEDDAFYGVWRHRCLHRETNIALAFEQNGMWEQASVAYETALGRARTGAIPFSEAEYCLWEDHWILSSQKLQNWDILFELGRSESDASLMMESAWRTKNWSEETEAMKGHLRQLSEIPTPRRRIFEAFMALLTPNDAEKPFDFNLCLGDASQLALHKWVSLPSQISLAHVPLLQHFQHLVELQEAVQIFKSLASTDASNLEKKSSELKLVLQAWRERLPMYHDDIDLWSDLIGWRRHIFNAINKVYVPILAGTLGGAANAAAASGSHTYAYRGFHETAWIINRFAHVARKHSLLDACSTALATIYTLPNIEISEAFLKLREQARCHYQKPNDAAGLEVINNTNLAYFSASQKAEFFTLKGSFHARFGRHEEASVAFGQAVQLDTHQAKGWAEWGRWNDKMFQETHDITNAAAAMSCYLQAAGSYKNGKARPLLVRVLWLLGLDDETFAVARAFDQYQGDGALWYWIPLIPQLCLSLQQRETKQARHVLVTLTRHYPQSLFFHLRTARDEVQTQQMRKRALAQRAGESVDTVMADAGAQPTDPLQPQESRPGYQNVEEVVQTLKTGAPLLILSMETVVDQFNNRFKATPEEDTYRHICMLVADACQNTQLRMVATEDDGSISDPTMRTLIQVSSNLQPDAKVQFEEDFINTRPVHAEYMRKLQQWRDRYETLLDQRPRWQSLELLSHYLTEFEYNKVDEIEVPGQYTEEKEGNQNFARIQKFAPKVENYRHNGTVCRRLTMIGHDHSRTTFSVQNPSHRQTVREEKTMQLLRTFNSVLARKKETRKRNLSFHLPVSVTCSVSLRLMQSDSSDICFSDIYDLHCKKMGMAREDPLLFTADRVSKVFREYKQMPTRRQLSKPEFLHLKKETFDEVGLKMVPDDVILRYLISVTKTPADLWRMRKQFALQLAANSFMTYTLPLGNRQAQRFMLSRDTGQISMLDIVSSIGGHTPSFTTNDSVPFRLTPNMQRVLGPVFTEGLLTTGIMSIARSLTEPEFELDQQLCLFMRDEFAMWMTARNRPYVPDANLLLHYKDAVSMFVRKAESMACKIEREQALQGNPLSQPVIQTVTNLISTATNPIQLVKMGEAYSPWF